MPTDSPTTSKDEFLVTSSELNSTLSELNNRWNRLAIDASPQGVWLSTVNSVEPLEELWAHDDRRDTGPDSVEAYPNAFVAEDLVGKRASGDIVAVIDNTRLMVIRVAATSRSSSESDAAVSRKLTEWSSEFPSPEFDVLLALGNVDTLKFELPLVSGWDGIRVEEISSS